MIHYNFQNNRVLILNVARCKNTSVIISIDVTKISFVLLFSSIIPIKSKDWWLQEGATDTLGSIFFHFMPFWGMSNVSKVIDPVQNIKQTMVQTMSAIN